MINFVNLDGVELGNSTPADLTTFAFISLKMSHVLNDLSIVFDKHNIKDMIPSYGIKIDISIPIETIEELILRVEKLLPKGISFYEVDNRKVFEVRGPKGGVVSEYVCYLIAK